MLWRKTKDRIGNGWKGLQFEIRIFPAVLTEMMTFEQRSGGSMRESHADIRGTCSKQKEQPM